jgi:cytochrome P450
VDLLAHFARPLPIDVICELVGIAPGDRGTWRTYGAALAAGHGPTFAQAIPAILRDAVAAVAHRTREPGTDLLSDLIGIHANDQDRLSETELVTLVWHLVLAGQTPTNLVANAVETLLAHPDQLAALRADDGLMPGAVEELTRWCGPQLLSLPRYAREDTDIAGLTRRHGRTRHRRACLRQPRPSRVHISVSARHWHACRPRWHSPHCCAASPPSRSPTAAPHASRIPEPGASPHWS